MSSSLTARFDTRPLVLLVAGLIVALGLGYMGTRRNGDGSMWLTSGSGSYVTPTPGATPTLAPAFAVGYGVVGNTVENDWSIAEWVEMSSVVAEVIVARVDDPRFNTPSGALPTEDPSGNTEGLMIFRPVLLEVTRYWKGGELGFEGFAVLEAGGELYGVEERPEPGPILTAGAQGVVFLRHNDKGELRQMALRPRVRHVLDVADEMGGGYGVGDVGNFYKYAGSNAESLMEASHELVHGQWQWVPRTMPISKLVAEIEEALSP